ncbi:MAG: hypothetical protein UT34_C0001G0156 [candidate division WS6 bacterium GW2011_GWF2_39_15]|uniref:YGGT family protein n=1 Tax=candidate division WS6 bacterium GW2011_GWF2_39_15 TaxID=1619100 RepID=A0A0G0MZZ3_9BACT|nr:MAG: hypothetical protein UT34_C0001G0156 [candidate division WS6 bacterium GW2011_GWF2_39_15]
MTYLLTGLINFVFSLAMMGLMLRFLFRLLGANPSADFTRFIYNSTSPLLTPFEGIFSPYVIENSYVFEFSTLIAVVFYALFSWLLVEFVTFIYNSVSVYTKKK